jgi:hypothetical protein
MTRVHSLALSMYLCLCLLHQQKLRSRPNTEVGVEAWLAKSLSGQQGFREQTRAVDNDKTLVNAGH